MKPDQQLLLELSETVAKFLNNESLDYLQVIGAIEQTAYLVKQEFYESVMSQGGKS